MGRERLRRLEEFLAAPAPTLTQTRARARTRTTGGPEQAGVGDLFDIRLGGCCITGRRGMCPAARGGRRGLEARPLLAESAASAPSARPPVCD